MQLILGMGDKSKLNIFCDILSNTKYLSEFITFRISPNNFWSQGLTIDHCAIYEYDFKSGWFEFYEVNESDNKTFSLSTEILSKIINTKQPSQYLVIKYENDDDHISISFKNIKTNPNKNEFPKEFTLPLIDVDCESLTIPETEYSVEFSISSKIFDSINSQLAIFNESLTICCDENNIKFQSNGHDGSIEINLYDDKVDYISQYAIEEDLKLDLDFSIKHFNTFCKFIKISNEIYMYFSDNFPMRFEYMFEDPNITINFYLAPKIKDDDY